MLRWSSSMGGIRMRSQAAQHLVTPECLCVEITWLDVSLLLLLAMHWTAYCIQAKGDCAQRCAHETD